MKVEKLDNESNTSYINYNMIQVCIWLPFACIFSMIFDYGDNRWFLRGVLLAREESISLYSDTCTDLVQVWTGGTIVFHILHIHKE